MIEKESKQLILLSQACLGLITNNMNSIALECDNDKVILYFYLDKIEDSDKNCIEDIIAEFESMQDTEISLERLLIENTSLDFNDFKNKKVLYNKYNLTNTTNKIIVDSCNEGALVVSAISALNKFSGFGIVKSKRLIEMSLCGKKPVFKTDKKIETINQFIEEMIELGFNTKIRLATGAT
ncbi:MAG: hypothetical protein WA705_19260 [Candidatus Ozemobacteraceae bacterium]